MEDSLQHGQYGKRVPDMNEDNVGKCRACGQMISRNLATDVYGLSRGCPQCEEMGSIGQKKKRYEYRPISNIIITIGLLVIGFLGLICSV